MAFQARDRNSPDIARRPIDHLLETGTRLKARLFPMPDSKAAVTRALRAVCAEAAKNDLCILHFSVHEIGRRDRCRLINSDDSRVKSLDFLNNDMTAS